MGNWHNGKTAFLEVMGWRDEVDKYASLFFFFMLLSVEYVHRGKAYYSLAITSLPLLV